MSFSRELFVSGVSLILNAETMAGALIPKPNVISPVLEHFGFQPNEKGEPANLDELICKICGKRVPVTRGNTSNLRCHLANCHPAIEAQLPPQASGRGATSKRNQFSSLNVTPYMSLTVHYLSMEWTLKSRCLETVFMPEKHTSDNISDALRHAFEEWSLDEKKLACITTDNGANIVAAVKKLNWPWLNCFGHNLHLAVTNAMASITDRTARTMGLCHTLVSKFSQSWLRRRDLAKAQAELQIPQHGLILVSYKM